MPRTEGVLRLEAVEAEIRIRRDAFGVPFIEAEHDRDAWYGLGFCEGQDRGFQLELLARIGRGTLAEMIGRQGVPVDRLSRRIGFRRAGAEQLAVQPTATREAFESFARGVNDGATAGSRGRPHELALLATRRTVWDALDPLAVGRLVGFMLGTNWDTQLARLRVLEADGPAALAALEPSYDPDHPVASPPGAPAGPALERLSADLAAFERILPARGASNGWAVGPDRTRGGRPILANDPHLDASMPSQWYLAHVRTPDWAVAGAAFVGAPGIAVGHNGHVAWGVTNGRVDTADLFVEEVGPDGRSVRDGDRFVPCAVERTTIRVRLGRDIEEEVLVTPRGPIVGPAVDGAPAAVSLRASWLAPKPIEGFLGALRARSVDELRATFARWPTASLNLLAADDGGRVCWQLIGDAPRRKRGAGLMPASGADPAAGWLPGVVPFEEMPFHVGGGDDLVVTANNRPVPEGVGPYLGAEWTNGYRAARITEALRARTDWDVRGCLALQLDQTSLVWRDVGPTVLEAEATSPDAAMALEMLRDWNGQVGADSPAAAIFEVFLHEIGLRIARAKAPGAWRWVLGAGVHRLRPFNNYAVRRISHTVRLIREQPEGWFEGGWPSQLGEALGAAVGRLRDRLGTSPQRWAWGQARPLTFVHALGGASPLSALFDVGPFPWGGDTTTVGMCTSDPIDPFGHPAIVATLRMVVEVGRWDEAVFVLQGGQSGNPLSRHYRDMVPLWRRGRGIPVAWSPAAVERATRRELKLVPCGRS